MVEIKKKNINNFSCDLGENLKDNYFTQRWNLAYGKHNFKNVMR